MDLSKDTLGFSVEARAGSDTGLCLTLQATLVDQMQAEGWTIESYSFEDLVVELRRRRALIYTGQVPCPHQETCARYQKARERGARHIWEEERQLTLAIE